jgi:hypothetical protein
MRISMGCRPQAVAQEFSDDRKAERRASADGGEAVPQVVNARSLMIGARRAVFLSRYHVRILAYNLKRLIAILGVGPTIHAMRAA